jgi:hypothetical protein
MRVHLVEIDLVEAAYSEVNHHIYGVTGYIYELP